MKKIIGLFLSAAIIPSALAFSSCDRKDNLSATSNDKIRNIQLPMEKDQYISFDVYFDASKDENKIEISKEDILVQKEEIIGEVIINQLIKGPSIKSKLAAILPKDTRLISLSIKDGIAIVNFSKEAAVAMSSGKEEACLKSIASSLTQLSSVSKIKILIDSKDVETLGGNFDISKPFGKDEVIARKK